MRYAETKIYEHSYNLLCQTHPTWPWSSQILSLPVRFFDAQGDHPCHCHSHQYRTLVLTAGLPILQETKSKTAVTLFS